MEEKDCFPGVLSANAKLTFTLSRISSLSIVAAWLSKNEEQILITVFADQVIIRSTQSTKNTDEISLKIPVRMALLTQGFVKSDKYVKYMLSI